MATVALYTKTITTALTGAASGIYRTSGGPIMNAALQAAFTYGSGGTSATVYVQTSFDNGVNWVDVACFAFATTTAVKIANLSALTPVTTLYTPTDGTLTSNTVKDGVIGPMWRTKTTSVGTYAGGTKLVVSLSLNGNVVSVGNGT